MRTTLGIWSAALLAGALAIGPAAPAGAQTTVTMWTFLDIQKDSPRERALRQMVETFEAANPDIRINVESQVWSTLAERFVMASGAGVAPDISWVNGNFLGLLIGADIAADLDALVVSKWSPEQKESFLIPQVFDAVDQGGKTHALPLFLLSNVISYRADLLGAAGIDPASLTTWDAFIDAGKALTKDGVWGFGVALSEEKPTINPVLSAVIDAQGHVFNDDCTLDLANEAGVQALELQAGFVAPHGITSQEAFARTSDDNQDLFIAGRQAMVVGGTSRITGHRERAAGFDGNAIEVMHWPSWTGEKPGTQIMDGWFVTVWQGSPNQEAAARFVSYIMEPEQATLWTFPGGQVPIWRQTAEDPRMDEPANAWMRLVAESWSAAAHFLPPHCSIGQIFSDLNYATQQVVLGRASAMEALQEVERRHLDRL
jgi:multiple sugar transport system substrate-binding protein